MAEHYYARRLLNAGAASLCLTEFTTRYRQSVDITEADTGLQNAL